MTLFDVIYIECQGCPSPGTWRGWSRSTASQKNTAQAQVCFLPTSTRPKRSMVAGDAGFSFLPSYRPCQPEAPCSLLCSPLHPRNLTCACTGAAVQGHAGWHEGQESTAHRSPEDQGLCFASWLQHSRACTVATRPNPT